MENKKGIGSVVNLDNIQTLFIALILGWGMKLSSTTDKLDLRNEAIKKQIEHLESKVVDIENDLDNYVTAKEFKTYVTDVIHEFDGISVEIQDRKNYSVGNTNAINNHINSHAEGKFGGNISDSVKHVLFAKNN